MRIIVLNDGETWTNARGSLMVNVPDEATDEEIKDIANYYQVYHEAVRTLHFTQRREHGVQSELIARF